MLSWLISGELSISEEIGILIGIRFELQAHSENWPARYINYLRYTIISPPALSLVVAENILNLHLRVVVPFIVF